MKKKPQGGKATGDADGKLLIEMIEPIEVMRRSQSSCQIKFGPKTTDVTVKAYADETCEAVDDAVAQYKKAMKDIAVIDKKHRK